MKIKLVWLVSVFLLALAFASAKDVYVSAGKSGDGSKANPYGDLAVALAMGLYSGDVVHVSEGVYYGEGGSGKWIIRTPNVAIVGGYNKTFAERDPFKYKTILVRGMDPDLAAEAKKRGHDAAWGLSLVPTKASYNGMAMISTEGEANNVVIDGFVIDGYTRQTYKSNGDLKIDIGPIGTPLVSFNKPGCKVRNCVIMNSGGPGIQMGASGAKDDPESWNEVSNCIIVNTLMSGIDFRVGLWDPNNAPDKGYALIKNNSIGFVWSHLGEGYGILIGRQTRLTIEGNIIAFCTDYGMNNGFGNDKATLKNNIFFNNMGGVYRYFAAGNSGSTVVVDDPVLLSGKQANKLYYLSDKSAGNAMADPKFKPDPAFFDKFSNQIKSEGGGKVVWDDVNQWRSALGLSLIGSTGTGAKNFAPIYEHAYMFLISDAVSAGAKAGTYPAYASAAEAASDKSYAEIKFADMKPYLGKDVRMRVKLGKDVETSGYYVPAASKEAYVCYRSEDRMHFFYFKKGSEALDSAISAIKNGEYIYVSGALVDIAATIKTSGKYGFVVDIVESDD